MQNVVFTSISAISEGGALYAEKIGLLNIDTCSFIDVTAEDDGAALFINDLDGDMTITDTEVICK